MESLKKFDEICQKDLRQELFGTIDLTHPDTIIRRTLADLYAAAEGAKLHAGVPEEIRSHFETARNLVVYSWFYYPFNVTAQLCAYTTVEYALRLKTNDRKTSLKKLLKNAVDQGWISDENFSLIKARRETIKKYNEERPPLFQIPQSNEIRAYADNLAEALPNLRNTLAHGSSMMHEQGAFNVRLCAEIINQFFHKPTGGE